MASRYMSALSTMVKFLRTDKLDLRERPPEEPPYHELTSEEFTRELRSRHAEMLGRSEDEYTRMSFETIEAEFGIEPGQRFSSPLDDRGGRWLETGLYEDQDPKEREKLEQDVEKILSKY